MSLKLLSILALTWLISSQCPIKQSVDNLEAGGLAFVGADLDGQTVAYTFRTVFGVAPKLAIAIQHFDVASGNHGNFSVTPSSISQTGISIRFARNQQLWRKLRINFFASTRSDLLLGTASESFPMAYNTSVTSIVQFQSQIPNFSRSIMRVFLTGYQYKGQLIDIQISGRKLQARQLTISIDVQNEFYLTKVYYSFVVFAPSSVPFASYGGLIAQSGFEGVYYEDAHRIVYGANYILYGLNKVTLSGEQPIEFASLIDENFVAGLYSSRKFDQLNLIYIVLGVAPINQCVGCQATEIYAYKSVCMAQCPTGTVLNQYNDKGNGCRVCSDKLNRVMVGGKCVCNGVSTEKDGVCLLNKGQPVGFLSQIVWPSGVGGAQTLTQNVQNVPNVVSFQPTNVVLPSYTTTSTQQQQQIINTNTIYTTTTLNPSTITTISSTTVPSTQSPTTVPSSPSVVPISYQPVSINSNCQDLNQYWTGYRCACKVGYRNDTTTNQCVPLTLQKTKNWISREPAILPDSNDYQNSTVIDTPQNNNCFLQFEYFNGEGCVCLSGYTRINGICTGSGINPNISACQSQTNKEWTNGKCTCKTGFLLVNNECIKVTTSTCPVNSYDNGLGVCVCDQGYYKDTKTQLCVKGAPCPPSSTRNANGTCVCDAGLMMFNGSCAKCQLGAIWDTATSKCLVVCGQNAKYNETLQKCQCIAGFGIYKQLCDKCPNNYFIQGNYCVQCPVNSVLNRVSSRCECRDGFMLGMNGVCSYKCANGQVYDTVSGKCRCMSGLGRVNATGICQVCPVNTYPNDDTQVCGPCKANEVNVDGQCVCRPGFALNAVKVCVACDTLQNSFTVGGLCAFCPGDQVYNRNTKKCQCPAGKFRSGIKCFDSCKTDQLIDSANLCYSCPINEAIVNGQCACRNSYLRNPATGACELKCTKPNEFVYKGRCASCPLNLQYRTEVQGCACADGLYLNNYGVCEKVVLAPIACQGGFFFDVSNGCVACPAGCSACTAANNCTACLQKGFSVTKGRCEPTCGDGFLAIGETCDDNNTLSGDGCSSTCTVQTFFTCTGSPSVCRYNGPAICGNGRIEGNQTCDDGNTIDGDGCSSKCQKEATPVVSEFGNITIVGNVNTNINNVFVVLRTSKKFSFANQNEMENFMRASFPDSTAVPTMYCSQREDPDLDLFDCLAIYSSGIPNKKFNIVFGYDFKGEKGKVQVAVDPLQSSVPSRTRNG